jgi:peptidoglycan biosynthesis protein MviN/MurJ (putative lipid II flippase)
MAVIRPDPLRWIGYAFGAGLPARHKEWVLHDLTTRTWFARQVVRAVVQVAPIAVLLWVLLDPVLGFSTPISLTAVGMGVVIGLFYGTAFAWGSTEHRAVKAGYPEGTVEKVRDQRRRREASERAAHRG